MPPLSPYKARFEVTICTVADLRALNIEPTTEIKDQLVESLCDKPLRMGWGVTGAPAVGWVKSAGWYECDGDIGAALKADVELVGEIAPVLLFNHMDKASGETRRVVVDQLSLVHMRRPMVATPCG